MKYIIILLFALLPLYSCEANNKNTIREARYKACFIASKEQKKHIQEKYIHLNQNVIIRCATYMTLIFAYESNYWKSDKCKNNKNCFWIKRTTYDTWINYKLDNNNFKIYKFYQDWNLDFARLYMRFHLNKTSSEFVNSRSATDRNTYINFIKKRYWKVYNYYLQNK